MHWPVLIFLAYAVVRYFTSPFEYEARNELFQVGLSGLIFLVAAHQFQHRGDRAIFIAVLAVLAVFQSGYGMWQAFTHSDVVFSWERPETYNGRGSGTFICPNHLAGFLEMILGLLVARAAMVRRESQSMERTVILKVLIVYSAAMAILGIVVSLSRSGWLATVVGLSAFAFLGSWSLRVTLQRVALVFGLLAFMGFVLWNVAPVRNYVVKTLSGNDQSQTLSLRDSTLGGRTMMWSGSLKIIREYPVWGGGIGSWQSYYQRYQDRELLSEPDYAHNDILQLAADYGLVGAIIMTAVFVCFFCHASRVARQAKSSEERAFAVGAMVSVIAILVHSWFDFNLHIPANSFLLAAIMGFTAALGHQPKLEPSSPVRPYLRYLLGVAVLSICAVGLRFFVPTLLAFHYRWQGSSAKLDLEHDKASAWFKRASALDPKYPLPYIQSGDLSLDAANWRRGPAKADERRALAREAVQAYERALALNPFQARVWVSKARAHELAGEDDLALQNYQQATQAAPGNGYTHYMLGCFYRTHGDEEKAAEAFTKAGHTYGYNPDPAWLDIWRAKAEGDTPQSK
jgi:O-antigen ligase